MLSPGVIEVLTRIAASSDDDTYRRLGVAAGKQLLLERELHGFKNEANEAARQLINQLPPAHKNER